MILVVAAALWLVAFLSVSVTPRLGPETRRNAHADLAAWAGLGLLTAGFYWQSLFARNLWQPAGGGDLAGFLYPTYHFAQEWLTRGIIPLWNPYIFGGTPFLADIQTAVLYPVNLLAYFLSNPLTYRDLEYLAILHVYLAGASMYTFLRFGPFQGGKPLDRLACLTGALAFEFSDLFIIHFGNLNMIATAAWLPLALLCLARALDETRSEPTGTALRSASARSHVLDRRSIAWALVGGLVLAVAFFAGHIQIYLMVLLVLVLYAGYAAWVSPPAWKRITALLGITLVTGASLSAITLLPALEFTRLSVRSAFSYQDAAQFSLPPLELVGMLVPGFFGRGAENAWGPWPRVETGYLGVFPLVLAAFAFALRRNRRTVFLGFITLVGLVLALGGYAILHGWLYQFVPGFGALRAPARFVLLVDLGLAVLAAIGMDALIASSSEGALAALAPLVRFSVWIAGLVALASGALALGILILGQGQDPALFQRIANATNALAFFILLLAFSCVLLVALVRGWVPPRTWRWLALALVSFDLFSLGAYVDIGTSDPTLGYQRADIVDFLRANTGLTRFDSRTDVEGIWRPDTGLLYRLQDVYGDNPLVLSDFDTYWENIKDRGSPAYRRLNVKYVLTRRGTPMPSNFTKVLEGGGGITVWEDPTALPRGWVVYETRVVDDPSQMLSLSNDRSLDPQRVALLLGEGARAIANTPATPGTVTFSGYGPNTIVAQVSGASDGYLVLSEVYLPGWHAAVDGNEVSVVRADYLFRAVPVPAGQHQVQLWYDPLSFRLGAIVSGLALLGIVVIFLWVLRGR